MMAFKQKVIRFFNDLENYARRREAYKSIPDAAFYRPLFSPWRGYGAFQSLYEAARPFTLVSADRCYVLYTLALQATHLDGQWYECGVYKAGTAMLLAKLLAENRSHPQKKLHLFDTFEGLPEPDSEVDIFRKGEFDDTSLEAVRSRLESWIDDPSIVELHPGVMPDTFTNLCHFIYPRLQSGGFMIFDDYGFPSCPGARKAVDEFFSGKPEAPLVLPTGQAVVFKGT
jgi:O-methyltransferase